MGSLSAVNSINQVLDTHADEIREELESQATDTLRPLLKQALLSNHTYEIQVEWLFQDGNTLQGPSIHIDKLAERYPGCNIAY